MIIGTVLTGWSTRQGLRHRTDQNEAYHAALQLTAVWMVQENEEPILLAVAETDRQKYQQALEQVARSEFLYQRDRLQAAQTEENATALWEQAEGEEARAQQLQELSMNHTDRARLVLLEQIDTERREKEIALQHLRNSQVHEGFCQWYGIRGICDVIGGVPALQDRVNATDAAIQQDLLHLNAIEQEEYLQKLLVDAWHNQSLRHQIRADELREVALQWRQRARDDLERVAYWNRTAAVLHDEAGHLRDRAQALQESRPSLTATIENLLLRVRQDRNSANRYLVGALCLAVLPLVYFVVVSTYKVTEEVSELWVWEEWQGDRKRLYWSASYIVLHVLIFLVMTIWCQDFVAYLDQLETRKSAVIVFYFSALGSFTQAMVLHGIPLILTKTTLTAAKSLGKHTTLRIVFLIPTFAMELLTVWLSPLRNPVLNMSSRGILGVHILLAILLTLHYVYYAEAFLEEDDMEEYTADSMEDDDDDDETKDEEECVLINEETNLVKATQRSPTGTDLFPTLYWTTSFHDTTRHETDPDGRSLHYTSPHKVNIPQEISRLQLFTSLFLTYGLFHIVDLCINCLLPSSSTRLRDVWIPCGLLFLMALVSFLSLTILTVATTTTGTGDFPMGSRTMRDWDEVKLFDYFV